MTVLDQVRLSPLLQRTWVVAISCHHRAHIHRVLTAMPVSCLTRCCPRCEETVLVHRHNSCAQKTTQQNQNLSLSINYGVVLSCLVLSCLVASIWPIRLEYYQSILSLVFNCWAHRGGRGYRAGRAPGGYAPCETHCCPYLALPGRGTG